MKELEGTWRHDLSLRNATSKRGTMGGAKQRMRPERYYQEQCLVQIALFVQKM